MLFPTLIHPATDASILRAEQTSNSPIYLVNRPWNNEFKVTVVSGANPPIPWEDDNLISLPSYVMNLHFRLLKEAEI